MRFLALITAYLSLAAAATLGKRAPTPGTLSQVTSFGAAPTKAGFYIYVPKKLAASPGVVVAVHYCTGTAQAYHSGSPYATLAEKYGFIVIYPSSPHSGTCWDVSSKATLSHEGGGDSNTIANMVKWTLTNYKADAAKVFVTGSSSGAMMTVSLFPREPESSRPSTSFELADTSTERSCSDLSGHFQSCHRLLWSACWLLRVCFRRCRCMEQYLRSRQINYYSPGLGECCKEHVPWLHWCSSKDASLSRQYRHYTVAAELSRDHEAMGRCLWLQL
jgi:hypothetical protein